MTTKSTSIRWVIVVVLGCLLGLVFSFVGTLFFHPRPVTPDARSLSSGQKSPLPAKLSEDGVRKEVIGVIESQLAAFRKDDYPKAYHYAASNIRDSLSLPVFERMVRRAYPVIAQSSGADFGVIVDNGNEAVVDVLIADGSGRATQYQYFLTRELTGWKISGVARKSAVGMLI
jgi:hypothetical protein